jgi:hypothetical protein
MMKKISTALFLLFLNTFVYGVDSSKSNQKIFTENNRSKDYIIICDIDGNKKWYEEFDKPNQGKKLIILKYDSQHSHFRHLEYNIEVEATTHDKGFTPPKNFIGKITNFGTSFKPKIQDVKIKKNEKYSGDGSPYMLELCFQQPRPEVKNGTKIIYADFKILRVYRIGKNGEEIQNEELDKMASNFLFGKDDLIQSHKENN